MPQSLEELKAENLAEEEEEAKRLEEEAKLKAEEEALAELDNEDLDKDLDNEDPDGKKKDTQPWQDTDEQATDQDGVPVATHIKMKQKLKGRLSEKDDEIEKLRLENETLKRQTVNKTTELKKPVEDDFDSDEEYEKASDEYEDQKVAKRYEHLENQRKLRDQQTQAKQKIDESVDSHYQRASKLVDEHGIEPELFKGADLIVRQAIDSIKPKQGDVIVDQIISVLGEGLEKVMFFLGRNKAALDKVKTLLVEDPSGMKLSIFLGQEKQRLTNPTRKRTQAPGPAPNIKGDVKPSSNAKALAKRYKLAHESGAIQAAYNAKKEAKAAGIDVSSW